MCKTILYVYLNIIQHGFSVKLVLLNHKDIKKKLKINPFYSFLCTSYAQRDEIITPIADVRTLDMTYLK